MLQASAAEIAERQRVESERVGAADGRDEHAAGDRAEHEPEVARARAHCVRPHELLRRNEVRDGRLRRREVRGLRDRAERRQRDQERGRVREDEREVDHGAGGVGADHDDAAVVAIAEHAGERGREAVGADHCEQRGGTPDGRMGPAEDERHERHEGDLAAGHGEHAAGRETVNCGLVWGRAGTHWSPCGQG